MNERESLTDAQRWEQWQRDLSTQADGHVHCDYGADERPGRPTCTEALWDLRLQLDEAERRAQVYADGVNKMPDYLWEHVTVWLTANQVKASDVRHGVFPLGMVQRWIERALAAEELLRAVRQGAEHGE